MLARCIIHRDDQVPYRLGYPAVRAGILVDHHAAQGCAFAFDAVFTAPLGRFDNAHPLQNTLEPAVAALAFKLGFVFAVRARDVPASKTAFVQLDDMIDLPAAGTAFGYLA